MKAYELNQIGYASVPALTDEELAKSEKLIKEFLKNNPSKYYLVLNNDVRYYTFYTWKNEFKFNEMAHEILDIMLELGEIKSIEKSEVASAIEFWVMYRGECHMFLLFNYENGVVEV